MKNICIYKFSFILLQRKRSYMLIQINIFLG